MMNHWKKCLQCWIPVSKKNDKKYVINHTGAATDTEEPDDLDHRRSSSVSFDRPIPQQHLPIPYRRSSAVTTPYVEDSHFWNPPPPPPPPPPSQYTPVSANDSSENYIPLDECLSGTSRQPRSLPKLVPRDIHLLDRVPPSPCSLTENPVGLSGMPEVYAPMPLSRSLIGPPSLSPRTNTRGGGDGSRRNHQGQFARRDSPHGAEFGAFEGSPSPNQRVADMRNNNNSSCFNFKAEHGRLVNSRSDPKARGAYSSVSSEASVTGDPPGRPCCPSRAFDSHSAIIPHDSRSPECLHYRNVPYNSVDRKGFLVYQQSLPLTINNGGCATMGMVDNEQLPPRSGHATDASTALGGHSLDSKILHMTPPAPLPSNSTTVNGIPSKVHKYVNANGGASQRPAPDGQDSCLSTPTYSEETAGLLPPIASQAGINDSDGYYNLIPTNNPFAKAENGEQQRTTPPPPLPPPCHGPSSSRKKQFQKKPHLRHDSPHRRSPHSGAVALPQRATRRRECSRTADDDSSSSYDDDGSSSGFSATNSNTSLNRPGDLALLKSFTTKPPAPPQQPPIEYLTLDLDQPGVIAKSSPGTIHRSQNNSTIDYIEIDPCRTKALSDTRRQLESNRHKTTSH